MVSFRFKKLALGGTFDILHKGHKTIISKAFNLSEKVLIGLSTDELAKSLKQRQVNPYAYRKRALEKFLKQEGLLDRAEILQINDRLGVAHLIEDLEAIMVSKETLSVAKEINRLRKQSNLKALAIIPIRKVKAEDGRAISSTRIRKGEIDAEGRLLTKAKNKKIRIKV